MLFVRAYLHEIQEMVFEAHDRALAFFGNACHRSIHDDLKTDPWAVLVGDERSYDRHLSECASTDLDDGSAPRSRIDRATVSWTQP